MDLSGHEADIPIPITSTYVGGVGAGAGVHGHSIIEDTTPLHPSNGPLPLAAAAASDDHHHHLHHHHSIKKKEVVKYRECLKNHAASIGGNAIDGCGEFMPSGDEGTIEALKCSACGCHRNFHRKETEGDPSSCECYHHYRGRKVVGQKGLLISSPDAYSLIPRPAPAPHQMIMPLGAIQTSESDEMEVARHVPLAKKRFRTKFTPEQKEKMLAFAERTGWRLQRQEESVVQQFCQEIGVKRRVLKVWMHNNKHNLAKKAAPQQQPDTV